MDVNRIFITGATGNIGFEVIRYLHRAAGNHQVVAGVRNLEKAQMQLTDFQKTELIHFDFEEPETFINAFNPGDVVFLLRPPHISDVEKHMKPLLLKMKEKGIKQLLFLSVQGAEKSKLIPHHKIEKLIQSLGFEYVFVRPSYFMQNLTTTLKKDIQDRQQIVLPSGKAVFNWVDVGDIGEVCAHLLCNFNKYKNQAFELTGSENIDFYGVAQMITDEIQQKIEFKSVNPIRFYRIKKKDGMETAYILVMIMLHFLPRFQKAPKISDFYEKLTGKRPLTLREFIKRERSSFISDDLSLKT